MYEARSKADFIDGLAVVSTAETYAAHRASLLTMAAGKTTFDVETSNRTLAGNSIDIALNWSVAPGFEATYGKVLVSIADVTKRNQAEAAARVAANLLAKTFASLEEAVFVIDDPTRRVISCNPAVQRVFGYAPAEIVGRNTEFLYANRASYQTFGQRAVAAMDQAGVFRGEFEMKRQDGSRFPSEHTITEIKDESGHRTQVVSVVRDISRRKQAEEQLRSYATKLQSLSRRLVEVQESERRHIARELHDEIGQSLTAAQMHLQAVLRQPGAEALGPRLQEGLEAVERVLEQVHDLSLNLRPSMLDDLGLEPALRWYTTRQAALAGLRAELQLEPLADRLDWVVATACFRVAQEALTNVVRHAQARTVVVALHREPDSLHLQVRDDGVGFAVTDMRAQAVRGASLGLLSMEERASLAGGRLEFKSAPGEGTEIHAWFPLKGTPPNHVSGPGPHRNSHSSQPGENRRAG